MITSRVVLWVASVITVSFMAVVIWCVANNIREINPKNEEQDKND